MKKVPVEKNKEYIVDIVDNGFEGEGIAKIDDFTIFIKGALKGEKIRILIVKVLSSYAFGKIIEIIEKSKYRVEEDCKTYKRCGGCDLRHVEYEETLNMKRSAVQSLVDKTLKNKVKVKDVFSMGNPYHYRNKLQFPIGVNEKGKPVVGVFANRTHEIIPIEDCLIQNQKATQIAKKFVDIADKYKLSVYDETTQKGLLRHIIVKVGVYTNKYMVIIVINGDKIPNLEEIVSDLRNYCDDIDSIILNVNKKNTNVILGEKNITIYGNDYILDKLGDYYFKISPLSFYQTNSIQTEAMYNYAIEEANITKDDVVFDLYCGIGTISIFMAKSAKKIYGVEIVKQAVEMARDNAKINKIDNVDFIAGDTEKILTELIKKRNIVPNIVVIDPPRKGLDETTLGNILDSKPRKVVYISCNPASLVRDLTKLEDKYEVQSIQPFDMFPFTKHVEVCALLELKNCQSS